MLWHNLILGKFCAFEWNLAISCMLPSVTHSQEYLCGDLQWQKFPFYCQKSFAASPTACWNEALVGFQVISYY